MRRLYLLGLVLLPALAAGLLGADRSQLYSNPSLPPREVLERMNLKQAWFASFPMDGQRDGFLNIVVTDKQVLALTRSGVVGAIDSETGQILWRTLPGRPYKTSVGLAYNTFSVYIMNGTDLYSVDRRTGQPQWQFRLPAGLSTAPVADDEQVYLCGSNTRVYAARVPKYDSTGRYVAPDAELNALGRTLPSPETRDVLLRDNNPRYDPAIPGVSQPAEAPTGPRPYLVWEVQTNQQLEYLPLMDKEVVVVSGNDPNIRAGRVMGFNKFPFRDLATEIFRFPLEGPMTAAPGSYEYMLYVGGADANLNAINMDSGRLEWRYVVGDIVHRPPVATDKDVFVTSQRNGLARVDRATGAPAWRLAGGRGFQDYNSEADRYLASNPKYVYAKDHAGRFLVLDRLLGKTLSRYDALDFVYPVVNEQTDRIFLAANNGTIVCLHDKEYVQPFRHRKVQTEAEVLEVKLKKLITMPPLARTRFRDFIKNFKAAHDLKIDISERAFLTERKQENLNKDILLPAINNLPIGEVLNQAVTQVDATTIRVRDTILVVPAGQAMPPMPGMGMPPGGMGNPPPAPQP